jgi:soluble lytic murein transglycosylase-like protein
MPTHARLLAVALCLAATRPSIAEPCWEHAEARFGVAKELLYAVARTESGLDAAATNRSHMQRTSSYDIGLMQINSRHLAKLASMGITEADLRDACTNLQVGAWLLADLFDRHGVSWNAVGAYNAACTELKGNDCARARAAYAWKVYRHLPAAASVPGPAASSHGLNPSHGISARVVP